MWNEIVNLFREYMGTGLIMGWFLLSLCFLLFREKRKSFRVMLIYVPIILLLLFFNPWFGELAYGMIGDEIYYRILWLIPVTPVIAYAAALLYNSCRGRARIAFACLCGVLVVISGSWIYENPFFHRAENLYHMPQSVVDICDAIEVEGREVMAVFPAELLQYVRQYSPVVCMPYGREQLVERWGFHHPLYQAMEAEELEAGELARLARESLCHYVILPQEKKLEGRLTDYDYVLFASLDGYVIYKDETMDFGLGEP